MELKIINDNPYEENVYIYYNPTTHDGVIIDPGDSYDTIVKTIEAENLNITAILLTHGHFDHIHAVNALHKKYNMPIYAHKAEEELLQNPTYNRGGLRAIEIIVKPTNFFADGDTFKIGETTLQVIHTPGHTAGGVCYYDAQNAQLFTGDTLFKNAIGRTDMPTGDTQTLLDSIQEKLFTLPDNVTVYPGHGGKSTIGIEKSTNPYF